MADPAAFVAVLREEMDRAVTRNRPAQFRKALSDLDARVSARHDAAVTTTNRPSKLLVRILRDRVAALKSEETAPYTRSLGKAAVKCVRESRRAAEKELGRVLRGAA